MTPGQSETCLKVLIELFPQSDLQAAELALIGEAISPHDFSDASEGIRQHRLRARYSRPTLPDLMDQIAAAARHRRASQAPRPAQTAAANAMIQANPHLAGRPEAELILRYHRGCFFRYRRLVRRQEQVDRRRDIPVSGLHPRPVERDGPRAGPADREGV